MTLGSYSGTGAARYCNPAKYLRDVRDRRRWYRRGGGDPGIDPRLRCIQVPHLDPRIYGISACGKWHCPLHGHRVRMWLARDLSRQMPGADGFDVFSTVLHLNRRCRGKAVTRAVEVLRRVLWRHLRDVAGVRLYAVPHFVDVRDHEDDERYPVVHIHFLVMVPIGQVNDLGARLDAAAAEAEAKVRRPQRRIVDSATARLIDSAIDGRGWYRRIHGLTAEVDVNVPVIGEDAIGEVIGLMVLVGRLEDMPDDVIRRGTEAGVCEYRSAAALGGRDVVGFMPATPAMWVPEQVARRRALRDGFGRATGGGTAKRLEECSDPRCSPEARFNAPGTREATSDGAVPDNSATSPRLRWQGAPQAWAWYCLRAREEDREMTDGHPGRGGRYTAYYAYELGHGQNRSHRSAAGQALAAPPITPSEQADQLVAPVSTPAVDTGAATVVPTPAPITITTWLPPPAPIRLAAGWDTGVPDWVVLALAPAQSLPTWPSRLGFSLSEFLLADLSGGQSDRTGLSWSGVTSIYIRPNLLPSGGPDQPRAPP